MAENSNRPDRDERKAQAAQQVMQFLFGSEAAAVSLALLRDAGSLAGDNAEVPSRPREEFEAVMAAVRAASRANAAADREAGPTTDEPPGTGTVVPFAPRATPGQVPRMRILVNRIAADAGGLHVGPETSGRFEIMADSRPFRATLVVRLGNSSGMSVRWVKGDRVQIRGRPGSLGSSSVFVQAQRGASVRQALEEILVWENPDGESED